MPRQVWIADALRNAGLQVTECDGWRLRGKEDFDPKGLVCHHTASHRGTDHPALGIVTRGRPDLAGPLCHVLLARNGTCYVIAAGKANHAGAGSWRGLSGNRSVLGIEAENDGIGEPWPAVQLDAFVRCAAALARGAGFGASMVCGHKEWTPRKIDPAGIDMGDFRAAVARLLEAAPQPTPPPEPPQEIDTVSTIVKVNESGTLWNISSSRTAITQAQAAVFVGAGLAKWGPGGKPLGLPKALVEQFPEVR